MDSGSEPSRGARGPDERLPPRSDGAPRGRSAGLDKDVVVRCHRCAKTVARLDAIEPATTCPHCGAALHACAQCRNFDTGARWECAENARIPARIAVKTAPNSCPAFAVRTSFDLTGPKAADNPADARRAFEALFKK